MVPVYKVLNDLSFIMESLLEECFSDGKAELRRLADRLETDPGYAIQDREDIAAELRQALSNINGTDRRRGYGILSQLNRKHWKTVQMG